MSSSSAPASLAGERKNFTGLLRTMRPRQWVKSVIVFAALVFDGKLFVPELFAKTLAMFIAFCLISSSVYIINDLVDMEKDRQHPRKRSRPLASGQLEARIAVAAPAPLAVGAMGAFLWPVSYTHLRAHETVLDLVCRLLLEKKKTHNISSKESLDGRAIY